MNMLPIIPSKGAKKDFLSPNRELRFHFNWIRLTSGWLFIIFGFYGWGTTRISELTSIPSILIDLSIFVVFILYYFFSDRYDGVLEDKVVIKNKQIYMVLGILLLLCAVNSDWMFRSLTGDEVAYALQSQGQSYVIVRKALAFLPQLGHFQFRLLLQISSAVLLSLFFLTLRIMSKLKKTRHFVLLCLVGTMIFRIATMSQGGFDGPNPPGASFYYLIGSTTLSPRDPSYRILSLFLASLFLTTLYGYLKRISSLPEYIRLLVLAFVISLPIFHHMSLIVEISIWTFYFASIALLQLYRSGGRVTHQLIFLGTIASTFRFPLIAILAPMFVLSVVGMLRSRKDDDKVISYGPVLLGILPCVPGLILVSSTKLVTRFNGSDLGHQQLASQLSEVARTIREIVSTFLITTNGIAWILAAFGVLIFLRRSVSCAIFLPIYLGMEFLLYFVFNAGELAYASKYIIEWFGPLVVLGAIVVVEKLTLGRTMLLVSAVCLAMVTLANVIDYTRIPNRFIESTPTFHAGRTNDLGEIYRTLAAIPFPYGSAFSETRKNENLSQCLDVGIVYGVYPQIMAGYSGKNVLASLDVDHKFLNAQEQLGESWMTGSAKTIEISGSNCVIVGFVDGQASLVSDLLANHWKIQNRFTDKAYQTDVYILTR